MGKIPCCPAKIAHREAILQALISCKNGCPAKHGSGKHRAAILRSRKNRHLVNKLFTKHGPDRRQVKIPHRKYHFAISIAIAKKSSSCGFVVLRGRCHAGHHCSEDTSCNRSNSYSAKKREIISYYIMLLSVTCSLAIYIMLH